MDRNTVIGFILIGLVLMIWMYMNAPPPPQPGAGTDSTAVTPQRLPADTAVARGSAPPALQPPGGQSDPDSLGQFFSASATGQKKTMTVESGLFRTELTTLGGGISLWQLRNYSSWNGYPLNYFDRSENGALNLFFLTADGKQINTRSLYFTAAYRGGSSVTLDPDDSIEVVYTLQVTARSSIVKKLTFHGDSYEVGVSYQFVNMENIISNFKYIVAWENGLRFFEHNSVDEASFAKAAAYSGGEETEIDAANVGEPVKQNISGRVAWTAIRNKYFVVAIIPRLKESQGAFMDGARAAAPDQGLTETYTVGLEMPFVGKTRDEDRYTLYLGPLDYDIVRGLNVELDQIMSIGAFFFIRAISQYFIIPIFQFLHWFIPNYGIVLIIFAFIIKVILYPLTKKSMQSMQKMQALQPMMTEIREKHKDDPQKMNQQVMRLYKEYGVNPAGGCLPMILQLPILYALWAVFSSTIDLRQAGFVWWMQDLATPDVIFTLPFKIPLFGVDKVSGLALAMGVTMFIQQKMSVQDPRQKMMVWMMPVMMTLLFNSFPSGLNLYYFVFNLLSIVQQSYVNKKHKGDPIRKVDEKKRSGGIIARLTKNLPQPPKR
ncbi:MAG TPA: membrane protein insertase YidC [Bacteroidota bacterium]|nr:membrane protein insertase YidC [Bacteroidota bacterium]